MIKRFLPALFIFALMGCRRNVPTQELKDNPDYRKAEAFLDHQNDSAFYYYNKVALNSRSNLDKATAYNLMGMIQDEEGDYFGSQESITISLKYVDTADHAHSGVLAANYNELGMTSLNLKNPAAALRFFKQALQYLTDEKKTLVCQNNIALAYQQKKDYLPALKIYRASLAQAKDKGTYARMLSNVATTQWLYHPAYDAAPELLHALSIRIKQNDKWGLNSSYAHLADHYSAKDPSIALSYAGKMYAIAMELKSPDDQLEALQKLGKLSPPAASKAYFDRYITLNDSLQTVRNAARNQFALIRFNAEKSEADNLVLQQENSRRKFQLLGLLVLGLLAGVGVFFIYRKRKHKMEETARLQISEDQRKTSKKVHDMLGNDVYRIMKKVQHDPVLDKDWLLYNIDEVYQRARDISYDIISGGDERFKEKVTELLTGFGSEETHVVVTGNSEKLWERVDPATKFELKYILQELMVNMQKHSRARNVLVRFEEQDGACILSYSDDGVGMPPGAAQKNGLTNTGNRIKSIGGEINFENGNEKGLIIRISFPLA